MPTDTERPIIDSWKLGLLERRAPRLGARYIIYMPWAHAVPEHPMATSPAMQLDMRLGCLVRTLQACVVAVLYQVSGCLVVDLPRAAQP